MATPYTGNGQTRMPLSCCDKSWGAGPVDYCDCDLRWMEKVTWGNVPFTCTDPGKNCEY